MNDNTETKPVNSTEAKAIVKLEKILEHPNRLTDFDDEEKEALRRVIKIIKGLDTLGSVASFIKAIAIWLTTLITLFVLIRNGFIEYVLNIMSNGGK